MSLVHVASEPTSLVQVDDQCQMVEAWAGQCNDVPALRDATNKLAAIDEYLSRTSTDGRARVAAAMRRLEARIGDLLGPPTPGRPTEPNPHRNEGFHDQQLSDFRQMAANPEVVEKVIEDSTDDEPPSRRKVIAAIKQQAKESDMPGLGAYNRSRTERARERAAEAVRLAKDEGMSTKRIAAQLGVSDSSVNNYLTAADRTPRGGDRAYLNRLTTQATGLTLAADKHGGAVVDPEPDEVARWVGDLTKTIRSLSQLRTRIKEQNKP